MVILLAQSAKLVTPNREEYGVSDHTTGRTLRRFLYVDYLPDARHRLWAKCTVRLYDGPGTLRLTRANSNDVGLVQGSPLLRAQLTSLLIQNVCTRIELEPGQEEGQPRTLVRFVLSENATPVSVINAVIRFFAEHVDTDVEEEWDENEEHDLDRLFEDLLRLLNLLALPRPQPRTEPRRKPRPRPQ